MCSSAIRSSSSIVTPGCRWSPTRWMVSWTTSPAFAISSISRGDLRMIIRTLQHVLDLRPDGVDRRLAVDGAERAGGRVVVGHGPGQLVVEREALLDRLGRVVGAPLVVRAPEHPLDCDLAWHAQLEDDGDRFADLAQHVVERLCLGERAREAVQDEAVLAREALADQADHQVVGDELARVVDRLDTLSELGLARHRLAQDVAGGDVGKAVLGLDPLGLCPLPRALRTKEENPHYFKNPS